jgi:hypothetical protein
MEAVETAGEASVLRGEQLTLIVGMSKLFPANVCNMEGAMLQA